MSRAVNGCTGHAGHRLVAGALPIFCCFKSLFDLLTLRVGGTLDVPTGRAAT